jgi:hypothetical protein
VTADLAFCAGSGQLGLGQFVLSFGLFMARQQSVDGWIRLWDLGLILRAQGQSELAAWVSRLSRVREKA